MSTFLTKARWIQLGILFVSCLPLVGAQSFMTELQAEHDPAKRSEKALTFANEAFNNAKDLYGHGEIEKGDAQLENMTSMLNSCVESLETAHKARFYKKAEMNVSNLQRRLDGLVNDLDLQKRGWAEYTQRKLEEIHDKLLSGVMKK